MEKPFDAPNTNKMSERPPRPRILVKTPTPAIKDDLEFTNNKCSSHARKVSSIRKDLIIDIWFDKHYHDRQQHGDDNGKREGIEKEAVEKLVMKSIKHLLFYSANIKGFSFLNHGPITGRAERVVLKEILDNTILNVVVEVHFVNINTFEVTVKTAMCLDDFTISDGQFSLEMQGDSSILCRSERKKNVEISRI